MTHYTLVERVSDQLGYHCGYCGNDDTAMAQGMWAHYMNCIDYQDLIDRGWRRSGKYCYKPLMSKTCCPQYTIRCHALEYRLTKSKKKVLHKMKQFLMTEGDDEIVKWRAKNAYERKPEESEIKEETNMEVTSNSLSFQPDTETQAFSPNNIPQPRSESSKSRKIVSKGSGPDPSKPLCKKAKILRLEKKMKKKDSGGAGDQLTTTLKQNQPKSLKEQIPHLNLTPEMKRRLEIRIVPAQVGHPEFEATRAESHSIYQKYQQVIHGDEPSECNEKQWIRFLVDCPLNRDPSGPGPGYGNYHKHYVLDGKIIAVGVIDILPRCVSSVYLYYDPDYGFLSLGVYSALSEIELTRSFHEEDPQLEHYYMGFYIHSCPKMKYKSAYPPSDLLCPETYEWVPTHLCDPVLDKQKYCRLNVLNGGSPTAIDRHRGNDFNLDNLGILYRRNLLKYPAYARWKYIHVRKEEDPELSNEFKKQAAKEELAMKEEREELREYVSMVGTVCAQRMYLHRQQEI